MRAVALICALFLSACATPMQTGNQCVVAPGFLEAQSTFTWRSENPLDLDDQTGYISPIVAKGLSEAVLVELGRKGFTYVETEEADIEVALTLRTRRELMSMTINESPCVDADCWERIDPASTTRMDMRTIGFLAADVYFENQPIWRGWVERTLYPKDRDNASAVVSEAVPALFESFPP